MSNREIITPRLRLRPHSLADYDAVFALWQEPEVFHHITGQPTGPEDQWNRILRFIGHWAALDFGMFLVEDRASGALLGEIGLADFGRAMGEDFDGAPEAAWVLGPWAHGRGIAYEAASAALDWGVAHFGPTRFVCMITPLNQRSVSLATRLGFEAMRTATYHDHPVILFERNGSA